LVPKQTAARNAKKLENIDIERVHAFEGEIPFTSETLHKIVELKGVYALDLNAKASHRLRDKS
jgi:hypothetical protein